MKRIVFVLISFLLINCSEDKNADLPLLNFLPENAAMIFKIKNHKAFLNTIENNGLLAEFKNTDIHQQTLKNVEYLQYLKPKSEGILTFIVSSGDKLDFMYITENTPDLINLKGNGDRKVENFESDGLELFKYTIKGASFYVGLVEEKVLVTTSASLFSKIKGKPLSSSLKTLEKLFDKTDGSKSGTLFINLDECETLFPKMLKSTSKLGISNFSDWISLDLHDHNQKIKLNGVSIANDQKWNFIDLFLNTKPTTNEIAKFAPIRSEGILSYTFDNYEVFAKNRELATNLVSPVEPSMESVKEIGIVFFDRQRAVVLDTYGAEGISEYLLNQKKAITEYQGQEILELDSNDFLNNRFSPLIKNFHAKFCVFLENAFIFADRSSTLRSIIRNHKNGTVFSKSQIYTSISNEIAEESSILHVSTIDGLKKILKDDLSEDFIQDLGKVKTKFGIAAHLVSDKNFYHVNLVLKKPVGNKEKNLTTTRLFKVDFDVNLATSPQFVINHISGKKEIVVQDENNVLYLISDKGKVLWKKELNSMIQGKVKQVDIFKNGRLQLAFTTNNQFMVLDRNGKEVQKFTKTYEGGNLNPLAVFDYAQNKDYRFVVTQGNQTFMYNNKAEIVKGFKYKEAEQPIIDAPKHIVIDNKDFLAFKLKDGSLKLLNRVGDVRIKVDDKFSFSENEIYKYKNKFAFTDVEGVLYQIDLKGKISKTNLNLSNDHGMAATENSLVLMNENMLTIKGKKVELELGVYSNPHIFYMNNKIYVTVTDLQNEKVFLFDSQARPINNFPIDGSSSIDLNDIDRDKNLEFVVKKDDKSLIVYDL